jgi:hypothetical protein
MRGSALPCQDERSPGGRCCLRSMIRAQLATGKWQRTAVRKGEVHAPNGNTWKYWLGRSGGTMPKRRGRPRAPDSPVPGEGWIPEQPGRRRILRLRRQTSTTDWSWRRWEERSVPVRTCQRRCRALEGETSMSASKIVVSLPLGRSLLGAFAAVTWLVFSVAAIGGPSVQPLAPKRDTNVCFCALSSSKGQAYCPGESRKRGHVDRKLRQTGRLIHLQRRSGACAALVRGLRDHRPLIAY